jgi:membrane protease YdiL (CAAX protease family)
MDHRPTLLVGLGANSLFPEREAKIIKTKPFDWMQTPQLSVIRLLLAAFIPSGVAFAGFHVVLPALVGNGLPVLIAWPTVAGVMLSGFVLAAFILLRHEAKAMGISLWARMCLKRLSLKEWGIYLAVLVAGLVIISGIQKIIPTITNAVGFTVPDYMPFFLNPGINPATATMDVLSPGLPLRGCYGILPLVGITLLLNILTEELYFRAWMLPKLSRYGTWSWVINGTLFALYHTFQIWLLPVLLVASLLFSYICYRSKSIWPPLAAHLIGNFLLSILGVLMLIMK